MTPIGFIGLGNMGQPMVANIAKTGYPVIAMDQQAAARDKAAAQAGVTGVESMAELASVARVVILMLPDSKVVEAVVWGGDPKEQGEAPADGSLAAALPAGSTIVDMSSSFPLRTQVLGKALEARGITMIDAPVSGGVARAITGKLAIMAGGPEDRIVELKPMLETMGTIQITGGLGSGHAMKALNNYLSAAGLVAASEALVIGERFGLDPSRMTDVLNAATGKNNATENKAKQFLISGKYNSGFSLALLKKDVGMARDLAAGLGMDAKCLREMAAQLEDMASRLDATADHTEVHRDVVNQNAIKS